ncbi:hypothetical protein CCH79_00016506 [Gambusia affinis]|uniref:Uncharacterized protein n=1 Tax=Gambusia affinis TaxID=33528 RepID=A0A315UXM7_GAMAF|nr:hypothetical protein CCH79_00016506 [Gambusia affinis]
MVQTSPGLGRYLTDRTDTEQLRLNGWRRWRPTALLIPPPPLIREALNAGSPPPRLRGAPHISRKREEDEAQEEKG